MVVFFFKFAVVFLYCLLWWLVVFSCVFVYPYPNLFFLSISAVCVRELIGLWVLFSSFLYFSVLLCICIRISIFIYICCMCTWIDWSLGVVLVCFVFVYLYLYLFFQLYLHRSLFVSWCWFCPKDPFWFLQRFLVANSHSLSLSKPTIKLCYKKKSALQSALRKWCSSQVRGIGKFLNLLSQTCLYVSEV